MKLAIDASRLEPDAKTGVEYYSYWLIKELIKVIPAEVKVVLYSRRGLGDILGELPVNWQTKVLNWPPKFFWSQVRLAWQVTSDKPDVLFVPSHVMPFFNIIPTVITIHDISWRLFPQAYSTKGRWYLKLTTWWAAWRAKAILTVSQYTKDNLEKYYPRTLNKIFVSPLGPTLPAATQPKTGEDYFLVVGRVETKKNLSILFKAYADFIGKNKNHPPKLYLAGPKGRGIDELMAELRHLKLESNVKLLGWLPEQQLADYLAGARALFFPAAYEGFGLPVLDAWGKCVPVVAAQAGALREVVGEAGILLNSQDSDIWSQTMQTIVNNENLRSKLISLGKERLQEFDWDKTARTTWQVLKLASGKI